MKHFYIFIMTLLFCGCGQNNDFKTVGFTEHEVLEPLNWAVREWCGATGGNHCATIGGGENTVQIVDVLSNGSVGRYAWDSDDVATISIVNRRPLADEDMALLANDSVLIDGCPKDGGPCLSQDAWDRHLQVAFMHELGHRFGCSAELSSGNVMTKYWWDAPNHLTSDDVACADH
jgi:hypothetical protein